MTADIRIREAKLEDAEAIISHRRGMFFDMGHRDADKLDARLSPGRGCG